MTILILAEFYSNYSGNFIPSIATFKEEANKKGHTVIFGLSSQNMSPDFLKWERPFETTNVVKLFDFNSKSFVREVVEYINGNKVDLVYYHFGSSIKLSQIKKKCDKRVIFYQHIHNSMYLKKNVYAFLKRLRNYFLIDKKISKICCSKAIEPSARYIFPNTEITVCHNAIDFSRLIPVSRNDCESFNILLFGHNYYIKGVDLALEAVVELSKQMDVHLDIVMGSSFEKNKQIIIDKYGEIPTCVSLLPPTQDVSSLYRSHQVFLNASKEEGMSYANIEAYYSGALFICSDIPQNLEAGLPGVLHFKSGDVDDLKKAITNAKDIVKTYNNNIQYVESHFSLHSWCQRIFEIMKI